jgi:transposase-like protein
MRNLLTRVPKSAQSFVATMVRSIFAQPGAESVREQHGRIVAQLEGRFREAAALLDEAGPEILAFTGFPKEHWRQLVGRPANEATLIRVSAQVEEARPWRDRRPPLGCSAP